MTTLRKDVLYVGTVHPPGLGKPLSFSGADIAHHKQRIADMIADGLQIPVSWEHQSKARPMTPEEREAHKADLVKLTLGHVAAADVDGDALVNELEVPNEEDRKRLPAIRFVSPEIKWDWKDGRGKVWPGPSITHIAVTARPVQHDQKPFTKKDGVGLSTLQLSFTDYIRLGDEGMADEPTEKPDKPEGDTNVSDNGGVLKETLEVLKRLKIVLPPDTTAENLLERLHTAALTTEAHMGGDTGDSDDADLDGLGGGDVSRVQQPPGGVAMSMLDSRLKAAEARLATMHRADLRRRAEALFASGRIDRPIYQGLVKELGTVQLSLGADGELGPSDVSTQIGAYERLPENQTWPAAHLSHAGGSVRPVPPPEGHGPAGSDDEIIDTIAKEHWGTRRKSA